MTARTESRGPGEVPGTRKRFIYFDEHGNTGERLLDPNQPIFVLASNDFTTPEARDLAAGLLNQGAVEAKFTTLKKTPAGRSRLTRLLVDPRLNSSRVAVFAVDKEFMVFTKLVDIVMETLLHERGVDLYREGANLATANMMYCVVPGFCGRTATAAMLEAFVDLVRHRRPEDERRYLEAGEALIAACQDEEMRDFLSPFFRAEFMPLWLEDLPEDSLDPAIPSLFSADRNLGASQDRTLPDHS